MKRRLDQDLHYLMVFDSGVAGEKQNEKKKEKENLQLEKGEKEINYLSFIKLM